MEIPESGAMKKIQLIPKPCPRDQFDVHPYHFDFPAEMNAQNCAKEP
jgi:hypothetical protein